MLSLTLMGCTYSPPRPWEKQWLAQPGMSMEGQVIDQRSMNEHIYSSKENASGGEQVSGGGCGCN